jgi:hypothetical protein
MYLLLLCAVNSIIVSEVSFVTNEWEMIEVARAPECSEHSHLVPNRGNFTLDQACGNITFHQLKLIFRAIHYYGTTQGISCRVRVGFSSTQ